MQYESKPANGFRDIVRKRNTDAQTTSWPDMVMTISPPLLRGRGIKVITDTGVMPLSFYG